MKLSAAVTALALCAATPAFAGTSFLVDFEKTWDFGNGDVNNYYNGGTAADGSSGSNLGVSFVNLSGLSNGDGLGGLPNGDYYANAPTPVGTAYAHDTAFMNVAAGVDNLLSFYYSSPSAVTGAIKAYSGLNGTGTLLGTLDLAFTDAAYSVWSPVTFAFNGTARSFDLTASAENFVGFDNIAAVPEPETYAMLLAGLGLLGFMARRRNQQAA